MTYDPYHFNFSIKSWYISELVSKISPQPLTWDLTASSRFIESLLIRMPSDRIWVHALGGDLYELIDGHGRVAVLQNYLSDSFPLEGLEYLIDMEGIAFSQLHRRWQRRLGETRIDVVVIGTGTPCHVRDSLIARIKTRPR